MLGQITSQTGFWILVLVAGLISIAIGARIFDQQRRHEWARAARRLRLRFTQDEQGPSLSGTIRGRQVQLKVVPESSDAGGGVVVARAAAPVQSAPKTMSAEAVLGVVGSVAHHSDDRFLTGDADFDENVDVQGENKTQLQQFWSASRRKAFLDLINQQEFDRLALEEGELRIELRGATSDRRQVEALIRRLVDSAEQLDRPNDAGVL
ncbi:hypothetical protein SH661x_003470 [Planctomicrobium sp. SH661]|uniref:hypothetical protein n=1 Tax=Planctomicrobium sp. SH661 TaxID=3448124 RepID=UPI003F5B302A